jgi:hypothetical protein
MKASIQAQLTRQRNEIRHLLDQNESLRVAAGMENTRAEFYREIAEGAGTALKLIRAQYNVPGHAHVLSDQGACVLCGKTARRVRLEAEQPS